MEAEAFSPLAGLLHLAGLLADYPNADATALDALPKDVLHALGLTVEKLAKSMPDAALLSDISTLQG